MPDQPVTIAEELAAAVTVALLRKGVIDAADIAAMDLSLEARDVANALLLEAEAPTQSEWEAGEKRKRFRVVRNDGEVV